LSYWEEVEVKRQIDALVDLGKMKPSDSEYAYEKGWEQAFLWGLSAA
jgi:hypothetical protein